MTVGNNVSGSANESKADSSRTGTIVCSACILGMACRYDAKPLKGGERLLEHLKSESLVLVCPELLGELPLPRPPSEITGGDGDDVLDGKAIVRTVDGRDVTAEFLAGAQKALEAVMPLQPTKAILCDKSPACGVTQIFDGTFTGGKRPGRGVFAALLHRNGIEIEAWTPDPDKS